MSAIAVDPAVRAVELRTICDHMIEVVRTRGPDWLSPVRDKAAVQKSLEHLVSRLRALRDGVPVAEADAPGDDDEGDGDEGDDVEEVDLDDTEDLHELAKRSLNASREELRQLRETWERRLARAVDREQEERTLLDWEAHFIRLEKHWERTLDECRAVIDSPPEWRWIYVKKDANVG